MKVAQQNEQIQHEEELKEQKEQSEPDFEDKIVKTAIQCLFDQYLNLFSKAKIYEIKKLSKLIQAIKNYVSGYEMKKQNHADLNGTNENAIHFKILRKNEEIICVNVFLNIGF